MSVDWSALYPSWRPEARREALEHKREERFVSRHLHLIQAIREDDEAGVLELLQAGANPRQRSPCGANQMQVAMMRGHPNIVRAMAMHGADCKTEARGGITLLHFAARRGDVELARIAVERGKIWINEPNEGGETPLDCAVKWASNGAVVVQANFPIKGRAETEKNYADTIRWLILNGGRPSEMHKKCAYWPSVPVDVVKLMVLAGYNMDHSGALGSDTLVTEALEAHNLDVVEYALASGALPGTDVKQPYTVSISQIYAIGYPAILLLAAYGVDSIIGQWELPKVHDLIRKWLCVIPETQQVHVAALLVTLNLVPPRAELDHYPEIGKRLIERKRVELFVKQTAYICIALRPLNLSAHETVAILDHAVLIAQLVPLAKKWALVTLVKHFVPTRNSNE